MKTDLFFKLSAPAYLIAVIWSLSASHMGCSAGTIQESSCAFGYHALKINNRFIDQVIFLEERNRFFMRWHTNADMIYKGKEERTDSLLDDIITRVVLEDFLQNRSGITITTQETENYINQYIRPKFPSPEDFASFLHEEYKNEADLRKNIELHLLKHTCFVKLAKEAGLIIPQGEVDSLYRKHVDENRYAVTR
jgi:hypothetical protein